MPLIKRDFTRTSGNRDVRLVVIATEGEITEPKYFEGLCTAHRRPSVHVEELARTTQGSSHSCVFHLTAARESTKGHGASLRPFVSCRVIHESQLASVLLDRPVGDALRIAPIGIGDCQCEGALCVAGAVTVGAPMRDVHCAAATGIVGGP